MISQDYTFPIFLSWYLKAQQIAPKNGRPYNQLALLAVYTVSDMQLKQRWKVESWIFSLKCFVQLDHWSNVAGFCDLLCFYWYVPGMIEKYNYILSNGLFASIQCVSFFTITPFSYSLTTSLIYRSGSQMLCIITCVAWQLPTLS